MESSSQFRKNTYRRKCSVRGTNKNLDLSFHALPKHGIEIARVNLFGKVEIVDKRAQWLRKLNIKETERGLSLIVCSKHFKPSDYSLSGFDVAHRFLKKNAVPMLGNNIEKSEEKEVSNVLRNDRRTRRSMKTNFGEKRPSKMAKQEKSKNDGIVNASSDSSEIDENINPQIDQKAGHGGEHNSTTLSVNAGEPEPVDHDSECEDCMKELNNDVCGITSPIPTDIDPDEDELVCFPENKNFHLANKSVQVNTDSFSATFPSFIKSENDLITLCYIKSFSILDELTKIMNETYPPKRKRLLSTRDGIILTTARLKLDISFSALAIFFSPVTEVTIRNVFYDTVKKLATILQCVIRRVSKDEIMRNMPNCFENYQSTTSVLDCTEVKIQTPKCLKCKMKFYSHYKSHLTVKFMTEVTPAGLITFVSESFGGRASDKAIFNHSGILENLESTRDAVMVDRGFLIDDECMLKRIELIRPPFMKNREQLTEEGAVQNKEIASARVHIERVNQRIKQFQILNHDFPWHMIHYIDDIFLICCGLANLGTPITLADDKF